MRDKQRESTREQIVVAAIKAISEAGFDGVSTRMIAQRADVSQGLLTYHFKSKDELWRAAAEHMFVLAQGLMESVCNDSPSDNPIEHKRNLIRQMVILNAEHPEFMRFMIDHGSEVNDRSVWVVETYLKPIFTLFSNTMDHIDKADMHNAFYTVVGAAGIMYCVPVEVECATGVDPQAMENRQRHADFLAKLLVPDSAN